MSNIWRIKRNQTMTFGQLIECNLRNIFPQKSYTKYCGETSPRPFSEKLKLSISLDQSFQVLYSLFLSVGVSFLNITKFLRTSILKNICERLFLYFRIFWKKIFFWNMKIWQIKNLEKSEILEISEKLFQVFLFPSFWFCPTAKMENSDLKIL